MADMLEAIDTCPAPVIARVHGAALGGGMGLCAVADLVIAESGTRFGFTETRLGILPAVISPFVIAKIGESQARALFPGARRIDAVRAQRIGLVHEVVEGEEALDAAVEAAVGDLLLAGPTAARAAKAIVREVRGLGHGSAKWHTARVIARQRVTDEAREGLRRLRRDAPSTVLGPSRGRLTSDPDRRPVPRYATIATRHGRGTESERGRDGVSGRRRGRSSDGSNAVTSPRDASVDVGVSRLTRLARSRPGRDDSIPPTHPHALHREPRRDRRDGSRAHASSSASLLSSRRDGRRRRPGPARRRGGRRRGASRPVPTRSTRASGSSRRAPTSPSA